MHNIPPKVVEKVYIGETKRGMETRFKEQLTNINKNSRSYLAQHVNGCNCMVHKEEVCILAIEPNDKRKIKEALFINMEEECISHTSIKIESTIQAAFGDKNKNQHQGGNSVI